MYLWLALALYCSTCLYDNISSNWNLIVRGIFFLVSVLSIDKHRSQIHDDFLEYVHIIFIPERKALDWVKGENKKQISGWKEELRDTDTVGNINLI